MPNDEPPEPDRDRVAGCPADDVGRPMRADALKNRQRILEAAEQVFARSGIGVPIDDVAARAGVGVGTLYRHFPTKESLFEAIVLTRLEEMVRAVEVASTSDDPGEAFFAFVRTFARHALAKQDLIDACAIAGLDVMTQCDRQFFELRAGIDRLLERASAAGAVRGDVTVGDVIGLIVGICHAADKHGLGVSSADRLVDVVCEGLRVGATAASPGLVEG